ncbi:FAD-dependent monooxygenase [Streptomyces sp. NPDC058751]|uniref:FAD-dependent monooxygenase n=1 Tax=Streptomyces sp. NPDC058751 TaxID=3346623 RepID=UPI0036780943
MLVTFERAPSRRFHLVVGADGTHSAVRRLAFGAEERFVRFKDHYFAFADADASLGEVRWVTMFNTPGRMAGIYRSGNHAQAKAYFMFHSAPLEYDHKDVAEHKRLISKRFAGDRSWRIRELLGSALADPEFHFDALGQVRTGSWHNGRVALVGDSAWCASPASGAGAEPAPAGEERRLPAGLLPAPAAVDRRRIPPPAHMPGPMPLSRTRAAPRRARANTARHPGHPRRGTTRPSTGPGDSRR